MKNIKKAANYILLAFLITISATSCIVRPYNRIEVWPRRHYVVMPSYYAPSYNNHYNHHYYHHNHHHPRNRASRN